MASSGAGHHPGRVDRAGRGAGVRSIKEHQAHSASIGPARAFAGIRDSNDGWQLSLIGRNLTQTYASTLAFSSVLTGSGTGTGSPTLADLNQALVPARSLLLQLTIKSSLFE